MLTLHLKDNFPLRFLTPREQIESHYRKNPKLLLDFSFMLFSTKLENQKVFLTFSLLQLFNNS